MSKPNKVPPISSLKSVQRTADGKLQVSVICTDVDRARASGTVIRPDGGLERCNWLPSGKCYHDDSGQYDLDFSAFQC